MIIPNKIIATWIFNNLSNKYENTVAMISQSIRTKQAAAKLTPGIFKIGESFTFDETDINLNDLFVQLINKSHQLKFIHTKIILNTKTSFEKTKPKKGKKSKKVYEHCKKTGHTENQC